MIGKRELTVSPVHLLDLEHVMPFLWAIPPKLIPSCKSCYPGSGDVGQRVEKYTSDTQSYEVANRHYYYVSERDGSHKKIFHCDSFRVSDEECVVWRRIMFGGGMYIGRLN